MITRFLCGLAVVAMTASAFAQNAPVIPYGGRPYCREFTQKVMIAGHPQMSYGTSCMQPDGSWKIVEDSANASIPANIPPQAIPYSPTYVAVAPPVYYEPYYPAYYPGYARAYPGSSVSIGFGYSDRDGYRDHPWHHR